MIPFWVLHRRGEIFPTSKIAEIAACYAYAISQKEEIDRWDILLRELHDKDVAAWRRCLLKLIEHGSEQARNALRLFAAEGDPAFINPSRKQILSGQLPPVWFEDLVDYWRLIRPDDYRSVFRNCYRSLCEQDKIPACQGTADNADQESFRSGLVGPHPWFVALLSLMADGDDPAWQDFETHLRERTIPRQFNFDRLKLLARSLSETRLSTVGDWLIMELSRESGAEMADGVSRRLVNLIAESGELAGNQELRQVQTRVDSDKEVILNAAMLQIEDRVIGQIPARPSEGDLLDFINLSHFAMVRDERDLFETVCQAVEEIQSELQNRAEGVAGFWNGNHPKTEADCQNVLWPRLRDKLFRFGVTGVEERYVGPNRVDFWVELPRASQDSVKVAPGIENGEKKGRHSWLVDSVEDQLWNKYLRPTNCRHGIHVVLWFRDRERFDTPRSWRTARALLKQVRRRCDDLEQEHGISLTPYVIDVTSPHRKR